MVLGLFKKKDPICGMKEEKGSGIIDEKTKNWFCSEKCKTEFDEVIKKMKKKECKGNSCCH